MPKIPAKISRTIAIELVRVTEVAARAAVRHMGHGDKNALDGAAVAAMRDMLNTMDINGVIVIGEGEKDKAPMLFEGEEVGSSTGRLYGLKLDLAVDPVDGTTLAANGRSGAISVLAAAEEGQFLEAPEAWYMYKIAVGPNFDITQFDIDMKAEDLIWEAARQKGVAPEDITVCVLDRPRHQELIDGIRTAGARLKLISDGDVAGAIATCMPETGVDLLVGQGGSPEGVTTAAALKCLGGDIIGRLVFNDEAALQSAKTYGVHDPDHVYTMEEMAAGEVMFAATGVTSGSFLKGVTKVPGGEKSYSVVMRSKTGTVRWVETFHREDKK